MVRDPLLGIAGLCALALACGGGSESASSEGADGTGDVTAGGGVIADAPRAGCPPTLADAEDASCVAEGVRPEDCVYGDGRCYCGERPVCSGAEREPAPVESWVWVCERPPPAVRPDGCPGVMPNAGTACEPVGRACGYGDCCVTSVRCTEDGWTSAGPTVCPP